MLQIGEGLFDVRVVIHLNWLYFFLRILLQKLVYPLIEFFWEKVNFSSLFEVLTHIIDFLLEQFYFLILAFLPLMRFLQAPFEC